MFPHESLSSALGWISIACWIVVYSPQIIENYHLKSGEAVSIPFVVIWFIGDVFNLVGATMAGLLPTVIILAVYYTLCDTIVLGQIYYYRWKNPALVFSVLTMPPEAPPEQLDSSERASLLPQEPEEKTSSVGKIFLKYTAAVLFVVVAGILAWTISESKGHDKEQPSPPNEILEWRSQAFGWISAVFYLSARFPQIFKNTHTKCEGLSPGLFMFSIVGNMTYGISICVASMEKEHLIANASWLAGSFLTVFLDIFVLGQFVYYRQDRERVYSSNSVS